MCLLDYCKTLFLCFAIGKIFIRLLGQICHGSQCKIVKLSCTTGLLQNFQVVTIRADEDTLYASWVRFWGEENGHSIEYCALIGQYHWSHTFQTNSCPRHACWMWTLSGCGHLAWESFGQKNLEMRKWGQREHKVLHQRFTHNLLVSQQRASPCNWLSTHGWVSRWGMWSHMNDDSAATRGSRLKISRQMWVFSTGNFTHWNRDVRTQKRPQIPLQTHTHTHCSTHWDVSGNNLCLWLTSTQTCCASIWETIKKATAADPYTLEDLWFITYYAWLGWMCVCVHNWLFSVLSISLAALQWLTALWPKKRVLSIHYQLYCTPTLWLGSRSESKTAREIEEEDWMERDTAVNKASRLTSATAEEQRRQTWWIPEHTRRRGHFQCIGRRSDVISEGC